MKRLVLILVIALVVPLSGCMTGHNSQYRNIDHLKYSWCGHKDTTIQDVEKSKAEGWFGEPVKCEKCKTGIQK